MVFTRYRPDLSRGEKTEKAVRPGLYIEKTKMAISKNGFSTVPQSKDRLLNDCNLVISIFTVRPVTSTIKRVREVLIRRSHSGNFCSSPKDDDLKF